MDIIKKICYGMRELALFAGAGGGILGGRMLGWQTVCAVEIDPYCQAVLCQRQNEGTLESFPVWDDVCSFRGTEWRGCVDVVSGGFPCQDISASNGKAEGISGKKSGLWKEMSRIICEVQPEFAFMENSPFLAKRGLSVVLRDLAEMGYDAEWGVLGADAIGANHERKRMWILGRKVSDTADTRCNRSCMCEQNGKAQDTSAEFSEAVSNACCETVEGHSKHVSNGKARTGIISFGTAISGEKWDSKSWKPVHSDCGGETEKSWKDWNRYFVAEPERTTKDGEQLAETKKTERFRIYHTRGNECGCFKGWWETEPDVGRVAHGVANRMDRLRATGNGQVPAAAATAFIMLLKRFLQKEN